MDISTEVMPAVRETARDRVRSTVQAHGWRLTTFAAIGAAGFAGGLAVQAALVRAGMSSVLAFAVQTAVMIQANYLLNRQLTWRDRVVPFWSALGRWNVQRVATLLPGLGLYWLLTHAGLHYLLANAVVTGALTVVNYKVGDAWTFAAKRLNWSQLGGIAGVFAALGSFAAIAAVPVFRFLVYAAWMMPLVELVMLGAGQLWFRKRFREAPDLYSQLIIQITTTGAEQDRVNEIIGQIRSYTLKMSYEIWVVTERSGDYPFADRVLVVPSDFQARSERKARALEHSRHVRQGLGLARGDVKIIFNDDDVTLTQAYIERGFAGDYDVCEGIVTPRTHYAIWPLSHFLASHADDIRTHSCLVYCSVFQGILRRPLHVHGEGMVVTGEAEGLVTWNWPVTSSEDLVFGQRAADLGLRWGWFHEYAEITSPWTLREYLIQRRRWLWGDIWAVRRREVMPLRAALIVAAKYAAGVLVVACSATGLYLRATGRIAPGNGVGILDYSKLSILAWAGVFFACGWIGAGNSPDDDSRMLAGTLAVLTAPVSVALTLAAILIPLAQGDPRTFQTIRKTRGK